MKAVKIIKNLKKGHGNKYNYFLKTLGFNFDRDERVWIGIISDSEVENVISKVNKKRGIKAEVLDNVKAIKSNIGGDRRSRTTMIVRGIHHKSKILINLCFEWSDHEKAFVRVFPKSAEGEMASLKNLLLRMDGVTIETYSASDRERTEKAIKRKVAKILGIKAEDVPDDIASKLADLKVVS